MKTYIADEGKVFKKGKHILGNVLKVSDNFDDSDLIQVDKPDKDVSKK
jgi:hypothetical protein